MDMTAYMVIQYTDYDDNKMDIDNNKRQFKGIYRKNKSTLFFLSLNDISITAYLMRILRLVNANQPFADPEIPLVLDRLRRHVVMIMPAVVAGR